MHRSAVHGTAVATLTLVAALTTPAAAASEYRGDRVAMLDGGGPYDSIQRPRLFVIDSAGDASRVRFAAAGPWLPPAAWTADGDELAVNCGCAEQTGLYAIDPADGSRRQISTRRGVLSPDETLIAYVDAGVMWIERPDGSGRRQLTPEGVNVATDAVWHPEGHHIAFLALYPGEEGSLHVVNVATGATLRLTPPEEEVRRAFAWSPDGSWIGYVAEDTFVHGGDPTQDQDIFVVRPDGTQRTRLTATEHDDDVLASLAWAPDGSRIAIQRYGRGLWTIGLRASGPSRVETAAAVSRRAFDTADTVVIARADGHADALVGAPLAARHAAPLLLTSTEALHPASADEVDRLGATTALILGSRDAVSDQVETDLRALGVNEVRRFDGANRFDTARLVAEELGGTSVYVVEGIDADASRGWPDAVAVGALAGHQEAPILLVDTDFLPSETASALDTLGVTSARIIGGTAAVSETVADAIRAHGVAVDRTFGATRYETSAAVAELSVAAGLDPADTWFVTGRNYPDALASGPAAAAARGVILLVDGLDLAGSPPAGAWLDGHAGAFDRVLLVGGPDVVSLTTAVEIEQRGQ